jgi:hypothetical protein
MMPTLILQNSVVEVIENLFLTHQPYLVRINTWGQNIEIRVSAKELKDLGKFFSSFVATDSQDNEDTVF